MREIQFRAWDKENKFWLNPEYFYITGEGRGFTCEHTKGMYSDRYIYMGTDYYVIMQYTGLKDKKGKDLGWCDGDVITCQNGIYIEIFWHEKRGQWYGRYINSRLKTENPLVEYAVNSYMRVIGNTIDNPELIGEMK